jgi:protoheme IX farnesyltransferase
MTTVTTIAFAPSLRAAQHLRARVAIYLELAKARLSFLVVITTVVGYVMATRGSMNWLGLAITASGTALAAGCANALNQWLEVERDRRMPRTAGRPLPSGRISGAHALAFGLACGVVGVAMLSIGVNAPAGALALATIVLYVAVYTPLKPVTSLNTLAGAVVGAVPPMIGWAGATGGLGPGAWLLGALLFAWQMPHFLALAWLYREQYQRAGYRMLPSVDPDGRLTATTAMLYALTAVAVSISVWLAGLAGAVYAISAAALGAWLIAGAARLMQRRGTGPARRLFIASVIYLPLLMGVMVIDRAEPRPPTSNPTLIHLDPGRVNDGSMP